MHNKNLASWNSNMKMKIQLSSMETSDLTEHCVLTYIEKYRFFYKQSQTGSWNWV